MIQTINGRLAFIYGLPQKKSNRLNLKLSLSIVVMGIFLLPNLAFLATITPESIIDLTNRRRQNAGLNNLIANQLLVKAAEEKGQAIFKAQTFSHTIGDKRFSSWVRDTGYNYSYVGENLAIDFVTSEGILDAWDNSPLHKKNLLSPYYREIGVAMVSGKFQGQETTIVVQIFGAPATVSIQPLTPASRLNPNLNLLEQNLADWQFFPAENLLTHAIIGERLQPIAKKLLLPAINQSRETANKFIIQPGTLVAAKSFFIIYTFVSLIYSMAFLYYYYFFKINRLILS